MNIVDGVVGNTFIAIDSEKQAMRCDQIQEEGKLALTVSLKNGHRFGRSLSEAVKYDYSHVVECVLNTGDSFRATSGLLLMDMWGDWITVLRMCKESKAYPQNLFQKQDCCLSLYNHFSMPFQFQEGRESFLLRNPNQILL
jgi:hypothetical protein